MDENKRSFTVDGKDYIITQPTAADIRNSDWHYSKIYSRSLIEGIYTSSEMRDILKKRGIIGPEYDKRSQELADMLESEITKMYVLTDDEARKVAANEASEIRNEIFQWNHRLNGPMSNTCEQIADDAKLEFLTSCIIENDSSEKVWKDYDMFLNETNQVLPTRAKFEVMLYLQGLDSDFLDKVPEAVVLKDINDNEIKISTVEATEEIINKEKEQDKEPEKEQAEEQDKEPEKEVKTKAEIKKKTKKTKNKKVK